MRNRDLEIIQNLFAAVRAHPPGARWGFIHSSSHFPFGGRGYEFYVNGGRLRTAASLALRTYPELEGAELGTVSELLQEFYQEHLLKFDRTIQIGLNSKTMQVDWGEPRLPDDATLEIAAKVEPFFLKRLQPMLYVAVSLRTTFEREISLSNYHLLKSPSLDSLLRNYLGRMSSQVDTSAFPPIGDFKKRPISPSADTWIACFGGTREAAFRRFRIVKGAMRVAHELRDSWYVTLAEPQPGYVAFSPDGTCSLSLDEPEFPILGSAVDVDGPGTARLEKLLVGTNTDTAQARRLQSSLQFLADGWTEGRSKRFMNDAIALDALFGEEGRVRASIIEGMTATLSEPVDIADRIQVLLRLRNVLLHGESPTVESAREYLIYYEKFDCDPVRDNFSLLRRALLTLVAGPD